MARKTRRPNMPAWKIDHPALTQVRALAPLALLEANARDTEGLNEAVDQWEALDGGVKEYLRDRMAYNALILGDAQRRLLARIEDHLGSVRTGTRLTVEELKALNANPPVAFADAAAFNGDDRFVDDDFVDDDDFGDFVDDDEEDDAEADFDFDAEPGADLGGADPHELFDRMEAGEQVIEAPSTESEPQEARPKRKRKAPAKRKAAKRRASSTSDNGAGKPVTPTEVIDADGNPVGPPA